MVIRYLRNQLKETNDKSSNNTQCKKIGKNKLVLVQDNEAKIDNKINEVTPELVYQRDS